MELTPVERWILANQYRILERLFPEEAEDFRRAREAVESGDPSRIAEYSSSVISAETVLTEEERALVRGILSLYLTLQQSYAALEKKESVNAEDLKFSGFDARTENAFGRYADNLLKSEGQFTTLERAPALERDRPMIPAYRRMLDSWRIYRNSSTLSTIQILYILLAAKEPTHD